MVKHGYSKYKTKPLEDVLKKSFPSANEPLFGGKHSQLSVRVAVTSTKETGSQAVIMTNYNRSLQNINHCKQMKVLILVHAEYIKPLNTGLSGPSGLKMSSLYGRRKYAGYKH